MHIGTLRNLRTTASVALLVAALLLVLVTFTAYGAVTGTILPTSGGTYTSWTPNAGVTHYTQVDESTCNGNTDYVSETTVGERDSFGISLAGVPNGATITNIQLTPCASRNSGGGGGSATLNVFYRFNGVNSADQGGYALTGTTPGALSATNFSSLALVKSATSTLEVGAVYSAGTKGARLSRLATVITYTPQAPTVTTNAATSITTSAATLNGAGNPNGGASTTGWFRYSTTSPGTCNTTFGTRAPASGGSALGSGTSSVNYAQGITGLAASTTYYYCAIVNNEGGTTTGSIQSFTTSQITPPTATTSAASGVTATSSTLNGLANPNGTLTTAWFRYATTNPGSCNDSFGTITATSSVGSGTTSVAYNRLVTGLAENTVYYYCAIASNSGGTSYGVVGNFLTPPASAPSAPTSVVATNVSGTENSIAWTDNANNELGYKVERSQNGGAYTQIATTSANATSYSDTGATADQTYQYRVRGYNIIGNSAYAQSNQVVTATVVPSAPTIAWSFVSTSTPADVFIGWSHSGTNEDGFAIDRSTDNVNFTQIDTTGRDTSSYSDLGVSAGTYYYKIRAYNAIGSSVDSNTETAIVP
jgi:hypothetical protein